ncbi:MAG TPA: hypothetical protein VIL34_02500 [Actinopolymorphaceae bacterium]
MALFNHTGVPITPRIPQQRTATREFSTLERISPALRRIPVGLALIGAAWFMAVSSASDDRITAPWYAVLSAFGVGVLAVVGLLLCLPERRSSGRTLRDRR